MFSKHKKKIFSVFAYFRNTRLHGQPPFFIFKRRMASAYPPGFTLIELLVVIAIVGVLASVVLVALNASRAKARDVKRLADIRQLVQALEMYYDQNGAYPQCTGGMGGDEFCGDCSSAGAAEFETALQPLVASGFLRSIPRDPRNTSWCYTFEYYTNNQPDVWSATCGDIPIGNFPYVIRFATETSQFGQLEWNYQRVSGHEYCVHGS